MVLATDVAVLDHSDGSLLLVANAINYDDTDERVEDAALLTDIALATTAALGVAALIAIIVGPGSGEASTIRVGAGPTAGTGVVASMSWSVR